VERAVHLLQTSNTRVDRIVSEIGNSDRATLHTTAEANARTRRAGDSFTPPMSHKEVPCAAHTTTHGTGLDSTS
jgi:hypothetical protein